MKKTMLILITGLAFTTIILAFTAPAGKPVPIHPQDQPALFPDNIAKIFEASCYDCHGPDGTNAKAKGKIDFGSWADLSAAKKIGKMEGIADEVKKGDMPPLRYTEKNPSLALNQEQRDAVAKWAQEESDKLMGTGK